MHQGSEIGRRALAEARRWVGTTESPPGSNRTPFGAWFGLDGVPWCNIFVSYCFAVGAHVTIAEGFHGAGCTSRGCAYVPTTEAWLRATGMWLGRVTPLPGDIAIYNWDGGPPDHIGIVESAGGGGFSAIEGNSEGAVARRARSPADVDADRARRERRGGAAARAGRLHRVADHDAVEPEPVAQQSDDDRP